MKGASNPPNQSNIACISTIRLICRIPGLGAIAMIAAGYARTG
jgi:hypothetical protein